MELKIDVYTVPTKSIYVCIVDMNMIHVFFFKSRCSYMLDGAFFAKCRVTGSRVPPRPYTPTNNVVTHSHISGGGGTGSISPTVVMHAFY